MCIMLRNGEIRIPKMHLEQSEIAGHSVICQQCLCRSIVEDVEDVFLFLEQFSFVQDVHLWMLFTIEELKSYTMCNVVM